MKIMRKLDWGTVRQYCIKSNLYTKGYNEDYTRLSKYIMDRDNYIDDNDLIVIASDIYYHSDTRESQIELIDIITMLNRNSIYEVI